MWVSVHDSVIVCMHVCAGISMFSLKTASFACSQSKASGSPVIVVGTHVDKLQKGSNTQESLKAMFHDLYCRPTKNAWTYSGLQQTELQLVNALDGNSVQTLREYIYDFVLKKIPASSELCVLTFGNA